MINSVTVFTIKILSGLLTAIVLYFLFAWFSGMNMAEAGGDVAGFLGAIGQFFRGIVGGGSGDGVG